MKPKVEKKEREPRSETQNKRWGADHPATGYATSYAGPRERNLRGLLYLLTQGGLLVFDSTVDHLARGTRQTIDNFDWF